MQILRELIAIPSDSGHEQALADYIAETCTTPNHSVTRLGNNVAVHIPGANAKKALILNGHTDTVPPDRAMGCRPVYSTGRSQRRRQVKRARCK